MRASHDQPAEDHRLDTGRGVSGYIAYFLRVRLFAPGPMIEKKEWVQFIGTFVVLMLGTINVRLAAMRERRRKGLPNSTHRTR
jgi:hypothetical protein